MQGGLALKGLTRIPGTGVFKYPYKELDGKYRTGLDADASYIRRISDPLERELEVERVTELRKKLEYALGDIDLGPRSNFWNYGLSTSSDDTKHVQPEKLLDGDNLFDLSIPFRELAFSWLRVHPTIASSYQAWERGEYPADTQFYVADDEIEFIGMNGVPLFLMFHEQDCCEDVHIDEVIGDWDDLIGTPIFLAEVVSNWEDPRAAKNEDDDDYWSLPDSLTWTFYKLSTMKGSVTIRWYGTSNGYYSEEVSICRWSEKNEED